MNTFSRRVLATVALASVVLVGGNGVGAYALASQVQSTVRSTGYPGDARSWTNTEAQDDAIAQSALKNVPGHIQPNASDTSCGFNGCTRVTVNGDENGIYGYVQGYAYGSNVTICSNAIIYRNNVVWWSLSNVCEHRVSSGVFTRNYELPNCGAGTYVITGYSWISGSNDQPQATASISV